MAIPITPREVVETAGAAGEEIKRNPLPMLILFLGFLLTASLYGNLFLLKRIEIIQEIRVEEAKEDRRRANADLIEKIKIADEARKVEMAAKDKELQELKKIKKR